MTQRPTEPPEDAPSDQAATVHQRRKRYSGKNPRKFHEKYKELNPGRYVSDVEKVLESGKTPAGMHRPIMVAEVLEALAPKAGDVAIDCTLGGGGHARAILDRIIPSGRLIGLDADPLELPRTEERMRAAGFGADVFTVHQGNFAGLARVLAAEAITGADVILADLGVSSMQLDNPDRGFNYKEAGPLDMRMNPSRGQSASQLIAQMSQERLAEILEENADEPHARLIASVLKQHSFKTTDALGRGVRDAVANAYPNVAKADVKMSVRRTFQAIRIAVNDEFAALDAMLRTLPQCLNAGGRVAILTFHSGEDRRVKKAFQAGCRDGLYSAMSDGVIRASLDEVRANRRSSPAKLRWAVRVAV